MFDLNTSSFGIGVSGSGYRGVEGYGKYDFENNVFGQGVYGEGSPGVYGVGISDEINSFGGHGVSGYAKLGVGVYGQSERSDGVFAYSEQNSGLHARTNNPSSYAGYFIGDVYSSGTYQGSDRKLKQNIADFSSALDVINKLQPKTYEYRQDSNFKHMNLPRGKHYGLIAQDVEQVLPHLIKETTSQTRKFRPSSSLALRSHPDSARKRRVAPPLSQPANDQKEEPLRFKAINYTEMIPILVKGMQELSRENEELKKELAELKAMFSQPQKGHQPSINLTVANLEQNVPNPAGGTTIIRYHFPDNAGPAKLTLTNSKGQLLKTVNLTGRGTGNVNLDTSALPAGVYNYSLWVDGREAGTKQLVISR